MDRMLQTCEEDTIINPEVVVLLKKLWADDGFQKLWAVRSKYQVLDCLTYFMQSKHLDRIATPGKLLLVLVVVS